MTNPILCVGDLHQTTKALDDAKISGTILQLFKEAHDEQLANIRRAQKNVLCKQAEDMEPYEGKAFLALLKKVTSQ